MSRNFEDAYQAEVQLNIPDLWNRIESALPEKKTVEIADAVDATVSEKEQSVVKAENTNFNHKSKRKKNPYTWMKWASLTAAALFMVILLPVVAGLGILGILGSKSSDIAANESATVDQMMMHDAATEGVMEEAEEESMEDIYLDMDTTAEAPASNDSYTYAEGVENEFLLNDERTVLAMGMEAKVVGCESSSDNSIYCRMWLEIPEEAYETFEGYEFFQSGRLEVRYYYDDYNSTPVGGSTYKFDIIEVGNGSWLVAKMPGNN